MPKMSLPVPAIWRNLRMELALARRALAFSREYIDLEREVSQTTIGESKAFEVPAIINGLSDQEYFAGRSCWYRQSSMVTLDNPIVGDAIFSGCVGTWPIPLAHVVGKGFTAEPQLSRAKTAMKFGKPRFTHTVAPRNLSVEAFSLLGPFSANWYHTLIDQLSLVPRWIGCGLRARGVKLLMPAFWAYRWPDLPALLGIDSEEIIWQGDDPVLLGKLLVPVGVRVHTTSRSLRASIDQTFANPDDLRELRVMLLARLPPAEFGQSRRCVIDRADGWRPARTRYFAELADALIAQFGFERVLMGRLTPAQQLQVFRDSEIVVGEHGAGLASFIGASTDTHLVEVLPVSQIGVSVHSFNYIATALSHPRYHTLVDAPAARMINFIEPLISAGPGNQ
jgi:capsular polysaccharide biosynthesis protein